MQTLITLLQHYLKTRPFDSGTPDNPTVLDQLFCTYQDSHETDPPEIKDGVKELDAIYGSFRWMITMRYGICAAGSARPMNTRPSSMAFTTAPS